MSNTLRKTKYNERNEHFFGHASAAEPDLPTARELDELYLRCAGWEPVRIEPFGALWEDPLCGGAWDFRDAVLTQDAREAREVMA